MDAASTSAWLQKKKKKKRKKTNQMQLEDGL
jgi:hypothetical protein